MKKLGSILICIILMLSMVTMSASAADKEGVLTLPENDGTAYPVTGISDPIVMMKKYIGLLYLRILFV